MKESSVWRYLREGLKNKPNILMTRIESSTGNGVPDVTGSLPNGHFWIELKHIREWPKRVTTPVKLPLRPEQALWIKTRGELSGSVWVFVRIEDSFFLLDWEQAGQATLGWTQEDWCHSAMVFWVKKVDWEQMARVLRGKDKEG